MGANAETTRVWIDAFNRRDFEALLAIATPETEWVVAREHPASATHRGPDSIARYLEDWRSAVPEITYEADEIVERGDWVLVVGRIRGAGAESGAATEVSTATLTKFEDGLALRVEEYLDPAEARAELERRTASSA